LEELITPRFSLNDRIYQPGSEGDKLNYNTRAKIMIIGITRVNTSIQPIHPQAAPKTFKINPAIAATILKKNPIIPPTSVMINSKMPI